MSNGFNPWHVLSSGHISATREATRIVAASNASNTEKATADFVCDGIADEVQINEAITDLISNDQPGRILLTNGLFNLTAAITIQAPSQSGTPGNFLEFTGMGQSTVLRQDTAGTNGITITGTRFHIKNLSVVGGTNTQNGIELIANASRSYLSNIYIRGFREGVRLGSAIEVTITNLDMDQNAPSPTSSGTIGTMMTGIHILPVNASGAAGVVTDDIIIINPRTTSVQHSAIKIGHPVITGQHTGTTSATVLTDSNNNFLDVGVGIGETITNNTDLSTGTITAVTATTITVGSLTGGNNWDTNDSYTIARNGRQFYHIYGGLLAITNSTLTRIHTGADNASILTDSLASFLTNNVRIGWYIRNTTDGSFGVITRVTATTITATLEGGTDNDWDTNDSYTAQPPGIISMYGVQNLSLTGCHLERPSGVGIASLRIEACNNITIADSTCIGDIFITDGSDRVSLTGIVTDGIRIDSNCTECVIDDVLYGNSTLGITGGGFTNNSTRTVIRSIDDSTNENRKNAGVSQVDPYNLFDNGSFERWSGGLPIGYSQYGGVGTITQETAGANVLFGTNSVRIVHTSGLSTGILRTLPNYVALTNRWITISAWAYSPAPSGNPVLRLNYSDGSALTMGPTNFTAAYSRITQSILLRSGLTSLDIILENTSANPVYWDGLTVTMGQSSLYDRFVRNIEEPSTLNVGDGTTITRHLSATSTINFGTPASVPGSVTSTITVTGAALGDTVTVSSSISVPDNFILTAFVSSTNTVTVKWTQVAGAAADPDAGGATYRVDVWKH